MQALSGIIGRKAYVGGLPSLGFKSRSLTAEQPWKLADLSAVGVRGISRVAVKCVDMTKNTCGESALLGRN